jgi:hypothetical protein
MSDGAFTTWGELYRQMLDDLANRAYRTMQSYTMAAGGAAGSRTVQYRGWADFRAQLEFVKNEAIKEELGPLSGRTNAVNGGRG